MNNDYILLKENFHKILTSEINFEKPLMFDTETIGFYGKIRLAQFYQKGWSIPILVEYPEMFSLVDILNKSWLVCHNASYDVSTIQANLGGSSWVPKTLDDTFYLSRLHFYTKEKFSLDKCIEYAIGFNPYAELEDSKKALQKSDWKVPVLSDDQLLYASLDVIYLQQLYDVVKHVSNDQSYKLDIITLKSMLNFQCNGLPVDNSRVNKRFVNNQQQIDKLNLPINVNSYQQVRPYINSDKSNDEGLAELAAQGNTRAAEVRTVRKLIKENSFLTKFTTRSNKIYGKFSPSARSGRSTCKDQNLQQLPRSTKECFGVTRDSGLVMVYSDFSQLELRCIAAITGDTEMVRLYKDGVDIHTYTAVKLFNTNEPTSEQRRIAKTCNFALLYGAGVQIFLKILLTSTGIVMPAYEAEDICRRWKNLWQDIKAWHNQGIRDWKAKRPWQTPLGRKYVAKMMTDQLNIQVQGMGAEVAKLANHYMNTKLAVHYSNSEYDYKKWQVNFIHDSYILVVPSKPEVYKKVCSIIADSMQEAWVCMSEACKVSDLPMPVEVSVGYNWGDIEKSSDNCIYQYKI